MNIRIGYVLLTLTILFICLWFAYVSVQSKEYYRRAFRMLLWVGILLYVNRLFGISMEEGYIPFSDSMVVGERIAHYIITISVYAIYSYFMLCLLDQFHYFLHQQGHIRNAALGSVLPERAREKIAC